MAIDGLSAHIEECDKSLRQCAASDPQARLLMTVPGVGPVVAMCFLLALRDQARFSSGRKVASYFGLVPSLYQSGKTNWSGGITKRGNRQVRWALTIAANHLLRSTKHPSALQAWAASVAERRGKKTAVIALARKLCGVMWSMLKHNCPFEPRLVVSA